MTPKITLWHQLEQKVWHGDQRRAAGLHYAGPEDFVLREGRWYPAWPKPEWVPVGFARKCFYNALIVSLTLDLPYVEGYAINQAGIGFHHAWNLDERGRVIDTTWDPTRAPLADRAYIGVAMSARRADDATWDGDATAIDDHNRGWPLLQQPWTPEDSPGEDLHELLVAIMQRYIDEDRPSDGETARELADRMRDSYRSLLELA